MVPPSSPTRVEFPESTLFRLCLIVLPTLPTSSLQTVEKGSFLTGYPNFLSEIIVYGEGGRKGTPPDSFIPAIALTWSPESPGPFIDATS